MFDMRRIFLLLVALLTCVLGYAQGPEYSPVWAESGTLDFMMVGNTNHRLVAHTNTFPPDRDSEIKNGKIEPIKIGENVFSGITVNNVNYQEFRIAKPEAALCPGKMTIKKAFLSWGGRSPKTSRNTVSFAITQGTTVLGKKTITGNLNDADLYGFNKRLYMCHKDVTDEVNDILGTTFNQVYVFSIFVGMF